MLGERKELKIGAFTKIDSGNINGGNFSFKITYRYSISSRNDKRLKLVTNFWATLYNNLLRRSGIVLFK